MNLTPSEYELVTPLYFRLRLEGMRNLAQQVYQADMERTRQLAAILISPHLKKGTSNSPTKIWPLPWDAKNKMDPESLVDFVTKNKKIYDKLRL